MILVNFFIGFFAIFIAPQIFIKYKYPKLNYSTILIFGTIISFSTIWFTILLSYYLNLPDILIQTFAYFAFFISLYLIYKMGVNRNLFSLDVYIIWAIALILMIPLYKYIPTGYSEWDALVSWHRWGLELYKNEYHPINAAYPVFIPSVYAIIYKLQGTSDIWWTSKIALYILPLLAIVFPLALYRDYKNRVFLFIAILVYPYLLMKVTIEGAVDMPVMIMGMLTITTLFVAEIHKDSKEFDTFLIATLLLSGIASITKQSGLAFLVFTIIYLALNFKKINNKKKIFIVLFVTILYFLSFLTIYYLNAIAGVTGNLDLLTSLSAYTFSHKALLLKKFFMYPPTIPLFEPIVSYFKIIYITPILLFIALFGFLSKETKIYNKLTILLIIFIVISFFAWGKYASYHERNSYWIKAFVILFIAIGINRVLLLIENKRYTNLILTFTLIAIPLVYTFNFSNKHADNIQKAFQTKLGWEEIAKDVVKLTKNRPECYKVYTNNYSLLYNYHTRDIKNRIDAKEFNIKNLREAIENNCSVGSLITFRGSTKSYELWKKHITRLIYDKVITPYKGSGYLFIIKPNTKLPENYFDNHTLFAKVDINNTKDDLNYYIDKPKEDNKTIYIRGWSFVKGSQTCYGEKYLILKNSKKTYIINTNIELRPDVTSHFKAKNLNKSGLKSFIYKSDLEKGSYSLYILQMDKEHNQHLTKTDKNITIK